jgi:hypothetical protein
VLAFVLEVGTHLEEAAVASVLIVTVGGYMGAWGGRRGQRRRLVSSRLMGLSATTGAMPAGGERRSPTDDPRLVLKTV